MSAASFIQTEPMPWPSGHGEAAAVVALSPDVLSERYGLEFFQGSDNLDRYDAAAIRLSSGRQLGFIRHRGNPSPGTEIHTDAQDDLLDAIREFLDAFNLTADDLAWVRGDLPIEHLHLAEDSIGRIFAHDFRAAPQTIFPGWGPSESIQRDLPDASSRPPADRIRILFLSANSTREPLDLEFSRIKQDFRMARERDALEFRQVPAVTSNTVLQAMLDESPNIVHFAGHGGTEGIFLRDELGNPRLVAGEALASLFGLFQSTVKCVVLNACWSEPQAHAIRRHVPHVIGTRAGILDAAALAFSAGFYKALGAGRDVAFAFEAGKARVHMEGYGGEELLVLM
jgi:hypothetical protein